MCFGEPEVQGGLTEVKETERCKKMSASRMHLVQVFSDALPGIHTRHAVSLVTAAERPPDSRHTRHRIVAAALFSDASSFAADLLSARESGAPAPPVCIRGFTPECRDADPATESSNATNRSRAPKCSRCPITIIRPLHAGYGQFLTRKQKRASKYYEKGNSCIPNSAAITPSRITSGAFSAASGVNTPEKRLCRRGRNSFSSYIRYLYRL